MSVERWASTTLTQTTQCAAKHARWLNKRGFAQDNNFMLQGLKTQEISTLVETPTVDAHTSDTLCTFLERPSILMYSAMSSLTPIPTGWVEGATYSENIAPLASHLGKAMYRSKMASYNYFKFRSMKIKVAVSCSPFHYGTLDVRWHPLGANGEFNTAVTSFGPAVPDSINVSGTACPFPSFTNGDYCRRSTCSGGYLHIADQQVFEMEVPWIWPNKYMLVRDMFESPLVSSYPLAESFGSLSIRSIGPLGVATVATGNTVSVKYFVELTGVELFGPNRTTQSALVSSTAEAVKKTGVLGTFGDIGYHALKTGSGLLRLAGWSNDPGIDNQSAVNNNPTTGIYSTERIIPCETTSLGAKCHQMVDGTLTGSGDVDELNISYLGGKEVYLVNASWSETQTTGEIAAFAVTPCYKHTVTAVGSNLGTYSAHAMGPAAYLAGMHQFWRGTMHYRIKVVASALHRGKLRIAWDTYPTASATSEAYPVPSHIIDLADKSELIFSVPFMSTSNYARTLSYASNNSLFEIGTASSAALAASYITGTGAINYTSNGFISITVNSALSSPTSAAPARVIISSWCPDLELQSPFDPCQGFPRTTMMDLRNIQALDEIIIPLEPDVAPERQTQALDEAVTTAEEAPIIADSTPNSVGSHFGEVLTSMYQHIHRSEYYMTIPLVSNTAYRYVYTHFFPRRPVAHGIHYFDTNKAVTTGVTVAGVTEAYQFSRDSPLIRLMPCFIGHKGDFRYKITMPSAPNVVPEYTTLMRANQFVGAFGVTSLVAGKSAGARQHMQITSTAQGGGVLLGPGTLTVDCSEQSALEFQSCNPWSQVTDPVVASNPLDNLMLSAFCSGTTFSDIRSYLYARIHVGAAPNFRLFGFQYCPVIYTTTDVTDFPAATIAPYV